MAVVLDFILPWTQIVATAGQTVFSTVWTADVASDVVVYARTAVQAPDDATQLVSPNDYNVAFIGLGLTVQVTFLAGRAAGDIITITRDTPADRLNLFINTNFTPSMLNGQFGRLVMMIQQNDLYNLDFAPHYNISATPTAPDRIADVILPILPAGTSWRKNDANTAIESVALPANPIGAFAPFTNDNRMVRTKIVGAQNTIEQINVEITDANLIRALGGDLGFDATGNLSFRGINWPTGGNLAGSIPYLSTPTQLSWLNLNAVAGNIYTFNQAVAVVPPLYLGAAVTVNADTNLWETTLATTAKDAEFYAFIVNISGTTYTVQFGGPVLSGIPIGGLAALLPGTPYYLSDTVRGGVSAIPPAGTNDINLPVVWGMENGTPLIKMSRGYINGAGIGGGGGGGSAPNNVTTVTQLGNTFAKGNILCISADETFSLANAYSTFEDAQGDWVVTEILPNDTFTIQQGGKIQGVITLDEDDVAIMSGITYYLSATVGKEGRLTATRPVGADLFVKQMYVQQIASSNTGWMLDYPPIPAETVAPPFIVATGGTITTNGNRKIHTFNANDNFTITAGSGTVDYLIIAGGGGGGGGSGGGGAGGYLEATTAVLTAGVFPVVIGAGGAGGLPGAVGSNGNNSTFNGLTAIGGGGGGSYAGGPAGGVGSVGGSGGGGGYASAGGAGTAGQGNHGGSSTTTGAAGGGGSGGAGINANTINGSNGGPGTSSAITGVAVTRAGGGGGGGYSTGGGVGGLGAAGGGNGGSAGGGFAATANTGSGGGGGRTSGSVNSGGGAGGSGVVILSYVYM